MVAVIARVLVLQLASAWGEAARGQRGAAAAGQLLSVAAVTDSPTQGTVTQSRELTELSTNIAGYGQLRGQLGHEEQTACLVEALVLGSVDGVEGVQAPAHQSPWSRAEILMKDPGSLVNSILTPTIDNHLIGLTICLEELTFLYLLISSDHL